MKNEIINKVVSVGFILKSNKCGDFEVLEKKGSKCVIRFLNTGTVITASDGSIRQGRVKDRNYPTVFGVGYIGYGPHKSSEMINGKSTPTKERALWARMLYRVYSEDKPTYEGVSVCDRWLCFQNFAEDIKALNGYDLWVSYHNGDFKETMELDKDGIDPEKRIYSPETCQFLTKTENLKLARTKPRTRTRSHLSDEDVIEILKSDAKQKQLAEEFNTHQNFISVIRRVKRALENTGIDLRDL